MLQAFDKDVKFSALPLLNFKYMVTDQFEARLGLELYKSSQRLNGDMQSSNMSGDPITLPYKTINSSSNAFFYPGFAYHFSSKNILDIYVGAEIPLSEQTGVTIYSPASGKPDGFVVASRTVVSVAAATQGTVDIYMYQSSDSGDEMLAEWRSQTGLLFTRVTGVDYSTLTYSSMKSVYASALKNVNVPDIRTDDLIIVGTETGPLLAIKVMGVYDEYGTENDRCVLNIKYPVL